MEMGGNAHMLWKNSSLCITHLIVPWFSFPVWMKGEILAFQLCYSPRWKHFMLRSCLSFSSMVKQNSFNAFCIRSRTIHRDRAFCQKMTNYPKYAFTLSISCPVIVFLTRDENGPGQFNFSGLFLIWPQAALKSICSLYFKDVFSTHCFFEMCSAAHRDTFEVDWGRGTM